MAKHYAVLLNTKGALPTNESIESALATVVTDWLRFAKGQYLVYTNHDAEAVSNAVRPLLLAGDHIIVLEVNLGNRFGWASNLAINWIKKYAP